MSKKDQHYVPRVYLKQWETEVETHREPSKKFDGVYVFYDKSELGNGFSRESILYKPHLYTIGFNQLYMAKDCPLAVRDFVNQIYDLMMNNSPKPVYGKFGYSIIKSKNSIYKHIMDIDDWEFYYYDGTKARTASIINRLNGLRCYLIEDSFSNYFENYWEKTRTSFLKEIKGSLPDKSHNNVRCIKEETAVNMVKFCIMMYCRSPQFDPFGIYSFVDKLLKHSFDNIHEKSEMIEAIWIKDLYQMFYTEKGFYHTALKKVLVDCQLILFEVYPNAGSFITSDNPVFIHHSSVEKENLNAIYFPIDPNHLLFIARGRKNINWIDYRRVNESLVRRFNNVIYQHKNEVVISCEKNILNIT